MSQVTQAEPDTDKNALIASWFHVGEEVYGTWTKQPAIVLGFGNKYVNRGGVTHKGAGVYIDFMSVYLADKNSGKLLTSTADAVNLVRPHFREPPFFSQIAESLHRFEQIRQMRNLNIRICDLPDTPFWIGDTVRFLNDEHSAEKGLLYVVNKINYNNLAFSRNISYDVVTEGRPQVCWSMEETSLALVNHGNIWKFEHGEPLEFPTIKEEAVFHRSLGLSKVVYIGDIGTAFEKIQNNNADQVISMQYELTFTCIKYDNEEFGKRMRAHELKRLDIHEKACA